MYSHGSSDPTHQPGRRAWYLAIALGGIAMFFGAWGQAEYDCKYHGHLDRLSVAYHTLQLFVLDGPYLEKEVPIPLHIGRWAGALTFLILVYKGAMKVFRDDWLRFRLRRSHDHVVICGVGQLGTQLVKEHVKGKSQVVGIDPAAAPDGSVVSIAGATVLGGDATKVADLLEAGVHRASQVFAVSDNDQTNLSVALAVRDVIAANPSSTGKTPQCWIFLANARLRQTFQQPGLFAKGVQNYRVDVGGLDLFALAAREAFRKWPLDFRGIRKDDKTAAHVVIAGFGPMGQQAALQAARMGQLANFETTRLKITILERPNSSNVASFRKSFPGFAKTCELTLIDHAPDSFDAVTQLAALAPKPMDPANVSQSPKDELVTFVLCCDRGTESASARSEMLDALEKDDAVNLSLALDLAKVTDTKRSQLLFFQTHKSGLASLFSKQHLSDEIQSRVHPFGMVEDIYTLETLLRAPQDRIAKALHDDYVKSEKARTGSSPEKPAMMPWDQLDEKFRHSNRRAADHIDVKLRSIGLEIRPMEQDPPLGFFDQDPRVEALARMEHSSWCADTWLQGYEWGPERNEVDLKHDCLVDWSGLSDEARKRDFNQIYEIPRALREAGLGIYPQKDPTP